MKKYILLISFMLTSTSSVADQYFRCGSNVIYGGKNINQYIVLEKCGEPIFKNGNRWIYDKSKQTPITVLIFNDNGVLNNVEHVWR